MKLLQTILRRMTERVGYFTSHATSPDRVHKLLHELRPVQTTKPLVRMGGTNDGGYLIPDDLEGIEYCFSPGVSTTATFEEALLNRGIKSFLADYSVEKPPVSLREFEFDRKFVGSFQSDSHFTLATWINSRLPDYHGDMLLQMDIEGAEYPVLIETSEDLLVKFRIIVIEFHFIEQLFNADIFNFAQEALTKLLRNFRVVHIHPNNYKGITRRGDVYLPNLIEVTFLRNDRVGKTDPCTTFPHPLDEKNLPGQVDVVLPTCWYS